MTIPEWAGLGAAKTSPDTPTLEADRLLRLLEPTTWTDLEQHHQREVDALTADHRARNAERRAHPVEDFLFTYYSFRPAQLRRWHPGAGAALLGATGRADWRFHRCVPVTGRHDQAVTADTEGFLAARGSSVAFIRRLLRRTQSAAPQFGCFGLHEWAMVFGADRRHLEWPLRLGRDGTDEVVRGHQIRCSHFDAFRFFTPAARPLNLLTPDLRSREDMEQPGCLHASMDLYKWAFRLTPVVSSDLLLDCFRLSKAIREVDMRASPYDLHELGYDPITIETAAGKHEYVTAQRHFAGRAQQLRARLIEQLDGAFGPMTPGP